MTANPIQEHRLLTKELAKKLKWTDVYHWLVEQGYFPESYVMPPCFRVKERPHQPKLFSRLNGTTYPLTVRQCYKVSFPRTDLTDRSFGIIDPEHHNDISYHIARNWKQIVDCLVPNDSAVTCYSFPVPIDSHHFGRVGRLRSGRFIYEFLKMGEDDMASLAYRYTHLVQADIKNFYPSIYTHSIAWAIHGKKIIRKGKNRYNCQLLGNRLDRLFQYANDQKTNGIPIGPVVSDIVAEIIAADVDRRLTRAVKKKSLECEMVRFKDDYRILVKDELKGREVIKALQMALKESDLELSDDKTSIDVLPEGLFRPWVSLYHAVHPKKRRYYSWKDFRELYLAVLRIDKQCPGTGVIDRFLADIVSRKGVLKLGVTPRNLQKTTSMLLMLGSRRVKAFPKVLAIIESVLRSPLGAAHKDEIVEYFESYLRTLAEDEERNQYLISWIAYFLVSNRLKSHLTFKPKFKNTITRSVFANRGRIFADSPEFRLFEGCRAVGRRISMLEHLDIFNPPRPI